MFCWRVQRAQSHCNNRIRAQSEPDKRNWGRNESGKCFAIREKVGGRDRVRTCDPLLAKQVLSQLSYTPTFGVTFILKHFRARRNPFLRFFVIWSAALF